jgi:small-conductance mechanosensitive channel
MTAIHGYLTQFQAVMRGVPPWASETFALVVAVLVALVAHHVAFRILTRLSEKRGLFMRSLLQRTEGPGRLAAVIVGVWVVTSVTTIPDGPGSFVREMLQIAFIVLIGWGALATLHVASVVYARRFKLETEDNLVARRHLTQIKILERTAGIFIILLTTAIALMTLPAVRQYGVSLLASAGAAGIIAGLALQPLLTNLIAGVQIAITQPIRIDDAVVVQNEWGWIEEIGATYVVIRLWDWRRLILPLSYFIQQPFYNWTRQNASLIGTAMIYVDFGAPVERMREKLAEILEAAPKWDGNVISLQVTDLNDRVMEVRCLASARSSGDTFDLRCEVREKMIAFLREEHPEALPQRRIRLPDDQDPWPRGTGRAGEPPRDGARAPEPAS